MRGDTDILTGIALGAAGGLAGTMVLQAMMAAGEKWRPETLPPVATVPRRVHGRGAEAHLPQAVRELSPKWLRPGPRGPRPSATASPSAPRWRPPPAGASPLRDGVAPGLACWAAGYAGWLSALRLMPLVWRQRPLQVVAPAAELFAYGMATVAASNGLRGRVGQTPA